MEQIQPPYITEILGTVKVYRQMREELKRYKQQNFKEGTLVYCDNNRHRGYGRCLPPDASRPDRVEVLMESGAKWLFEFDAIGIIDDSK